MSSRTRELLRKERMEITLPTLFDLFITTKQIEGRSPKTISWHRADLENSVDFVGEDATARDLHADAAREFIGRL